MITDAGRLHIKRFLSGVHPDIGRALAFGVGTAPTLGTDQSLEFEIGRVPVELVEYNYDLDRLVFKCELDNNFAGKISEVGLYSRSSSTAGATGSRMISSFESTSEIWLLDSGADATYVSDGVYVGFDAVSVTVPVGQTKSITNNDISMDLSGYSSADKFSFAFDLRAGDLTSIQFRFKTDESNYYHTTFSSGLLAGLNILSVGKGQLLAEGGPSWSSISGIEVFLTAGSAAAEVNLEAIRLEDTDTIDEGYVLVARTVIEPPFGPYEKLAGTRQEVEFPLEITIA